MDDSRPNSPTRVPLRFREVRPGPRGKLFDALLVIEVSLGFLGAFGGWLSVRGGNVLVAMPLLAVAVAMPLVIGVQTRRMRAFKALARRGAITMAEVTRTRVRHLSFRPRADARWPRPALPGLPLLAVFYRFEDEHQRPFTGDFLVSRRESHRFRAGRTLEVFHGIHRPQRNVSGLVMRFYYRLSGAAPTEAAMPFHPYGADPYEKTDPSVESSGHGPVA